MVSGDTVCVIMAFSGKEVKFKKIGKYPGTVPVQVHSRSGRTNKGKRFIGELKLAEETKSLSTSLSPYRGSLQPKLRFICHGSKFDP